KKRRLLPAVKSLRRGEYASRLAGQRTRYPQARCGVEEILERSRHVAEAGGAAEEQAVGVPQILQGHIGGARRGHLPGGVLALGADGRHRTQLGFGAADTLDAPAGLARQLGSRAIARI